MNQPSSTQVAAHDICTIVQLAFALSSPRPWANDMGGTFLRFHASVRQPVGHFSCAKPLKRFAGLAAAPVPGLKPGAIESTGRRRCIAGEAVSG